MARPVVFIHGMFLTGRSWTHWRELFATRGFDCLAPSWPGREGDPKALRAEPDPRLTTLTLIEVVDQFEAVARSRPGTIVIGHSMGGLIAQLLLARGAASLGIAIASAPPHGVRSFAFSHLRSNAAVLKPGRAPIVPTLAWWKYAFWHTGPDDEIAKAFDEEIVCESRLVGRGPLGRQAAIDFQAKRPPLLMIAGELDHIIPVSLNRKNAARYGSEAPTELKVMSGRTHHLCAQPGWEEVAETCLQWIAERT